MTGPATSPDGGQLAPRFTLYSDRAFLTPGRPHVTILIPFWGPNPDDPDDPATGRYEAYAAAGRGFFDLGSLEDCDAAIFPENWEHVVGVEAAEERAAAFVAQANEAGKCAVIFFWSDSAEPVELDATVFRTSLYRSRRRPREFAQPAWSEDLVERYLRGTLRLRELKPRPVVGFCGYAPGRTEPLAPRELLRRRLGERKRRVQAALGRPRTVGDIRARAVATLRAHPDVDTNIVLRDAFWAGMTASSQPDDVHRVRREYVQNIVDSDYVLCARGAGNFSYRLYETLSCGRIPVFIDTDCVLPLESLIDWKQYCVWVDESDVSRIGDRVAGFHASLTPAEFVERQHASRRLWETHLAPQGFFAHLHEHFP